MLDTKLVKHLQSRPYHIRVFIFMALMGVLGVGVVGYTLNSMSNSFVAAIEQPSEMAMIETSQENPIAREENGKVIVLGPQKSTLVRDLKADISQMSAMIGGAYKDIANYVGNIDINIKSGNDSASNAEIEKIKKIKPAKLPISEQ